VRSDELASYLDAAVVSGKLRSWGVAGEPAPVIEVAASFPSPPPVVQLHDSILLRSGQRVRPPSARISFGVLGDALGRIARCFEAPEQRRRWNETLHVECGPEGIAAFLLRDALADNADGVVLFSTVHAHRINGAVSAASGGSGDDDPTLKAFRTLVASELQGGDRAP
jgi:hypothetical protein